MNNNYKEREMKFIKFAELRYHFVYIIYVCLRGKKLRIFAASFLKFTVKSMQRTL